MSELDLLETITSFDGLDEFGGPRCPHDDTCDDCRTRRLFARVAREYIDRGDTGHGSLVRCAAEFEERRRRLPRLN